MNARVIFLKAKGEHHPVYNYNELVSFTLRANTVDIHSQYQENVKGIVMDTEACRNSSNYSLFLVNW